MTDKNDIIASEPDLTRGAVYPGSVGIDFSNAVKLETTGTTCDAYRVRKDNTLLFVKKLKDVFTYNPVYRDALRKELSIGQSLDHECLPVYHYAIDDYIVLNYIDGETLAHLIADNDQWLHSDKNIVIILTKLVEVIAYLHKKGVVHCDVKSDNVMITHNNRNVKLIDLDKCYTDSCVFSPGSPKLYGAEKAGSPDNDFNGLAIIADRLSRFASKSLKKRIKKFIETCHKKDVGSEELLETLTVKNSRSVYLFLAGLLFLILGVIAIIIFNTENKERPEIEVQDEDVKEVTENTPETTESIQAPANLNVKPNNTVIDKHLQETYQPLYDKIAEIQQLDYDKLSSKELFDIITALNDIQQDVWSAGFSKFREYYPEMEYSAAYELYVKQPAFQQMNNRMVNINEILSPYIERPKQD